MLCGIAGWKPNHTKTLRPQSSSSLADPQTRAE
jgi:hypothetical protein